MSMQLSVSRNLTLVWPDCFRVKKGSTLSFKVLYSFVEMTRLEMSKFYLFIMSPKQNDPELQLKVLLYSYTSDLGAHFTVMFILCAAVYCG